MRDLRKQVFKIFVYIKIVSLSCLDYAVDDRTGIGSIDVFCKSKFPNFADKNGESCISVLEKVADCPAALPRHCRNSTADMLLR